MIVQRLLRLRNASALANNPASSSSKIPNFSLRTTAGRFNTTRRVAKTALRLLSSAARPPDVKKEGNFRNDVLTEDMDLKNALPTVVIAGAAGQLGRKILGRLLTTNAADYLDVPLTSRPVDAAYDTQGVSPTKFRLVLLDLQPQPKDLDLNDTNGHEVEYMHCDFTKLEDSWSKKFEKAYVAFLLATKMRFPKTTPEEAHTSMLITSNLLEACSKGKVERVVMGSSTDVVRGRADDKTVDAITSDATPKIGEKVEVLGEEIDSTVYAAAKVAGEAQAKAMVESGSLDRVIILRIGAAQPLEDLLPKRHKEGQQTVMTEGEANGEQMTGEAFLENWFRDVHLKDDDLYRVVDACVSPGVDSAQSKVIYVNAVSKNIGSKVKPENNEIGYVPPSPEAEQRLSMRGRL